MSDTKLVGNIPLQEHDAELYELIQKEKQRQFEGLEMIASENFTSRAVMECLGSCLTNKYSEGYPGARYYGGNQYIDEIERLCQKRALEAFRVSGDDWAVNVQPYSGSPANFAVYAGLLQPHDRLMGLHLPDGGHLTHGYQLPTGKKISKVSLFFESMPYFVRQSDGQIDYDELEKVARVYRPKMIIGGYSAHPRDLDYARLRALCVEIDAKLMIDMAHFSGLVAAGLLKSPFDYADIVTTTTHKSLRGPRAGMIFSRKHWGGKATGYEELINQSVFPGMQGGPHVHQIAGIATQLKEVNTPEFKDYAAKVIVNAQALAAGMIKRGLKVHTNGTENHLLLWDLRPESLTGSKMEKLLELAHISVNKNALPGDKSAINPGGIRVGSPALTTRGLGEADMDQIADFFARALKIAKEVQTAVGVKLVDFTAALEKSDDVKKLGDDVKALATQFPMPGL